MQSIKGAGNTLPVRIGDSVGEKDIAELWRTKFSTTLNSIEDSTSKLKLETILRNYEESPVLKVNAAEMREVLKSLQVNKGSGSDHIPANFYRTAPGFIVNFLVIYFNSALCHSYISNEMSDTIIVPVLKDKLKDPSSEDNYRPIAMASVATKIFEKLVLGRLETYLDTTHMQFGFKKGLSTDMCIFALKEVINYYKKLNTPVFICFLDLRSAFDRVSYNELFCKLVHRKVPLYLIRLLQGWYSTQNIYVRWNNTYSDGFKMKNGIRQGSVLSPHLFNVYVDELNIKLREAGVGCHIANEAANNFSYADDMAVVAPSATALNELLRICELFAINHYIEYNVNKSVCLTILPQSLRSLSRPNIYLAGSILKYVGSFKYLGHFITEDFTDKLDLDREIRSLYCRGNQLVRKFGFCSMEVKCSLFRTFCYSLYTSNLWANFRICDIKRLEVAYNTIFRMLIDIPRWISPRSYYVNKNVLSFQEILRSKMFNLLSRVKSTSNIIIVRILSSDAVPLSSLFGRWHEYLYVNSTSNSLLSLVPLH